MSIENFPTETLERILNCLSVKDLEACRLVNRRWYDLSGVLLDSRWRKKCEADFPGASAEARRKSQYKLSWEQLHRSLSLGVHMAEAKMTAQSHPLPNVRNWKGSDDHKRQFIILDNGLIATPIFSTKKKFKEYKGEKIGDVWIYKYKIKPTDDDAEKKEDDDHTTRELLKILDSDTDQGPRNKKQKLGEESDENNEKRDKVNTENHAQNMEICENDNKLETIVTHDKCCTVTITNSTGKTETEAKTAEVDVANDAVMNESIPLKKRGRPKSANKGKGKQKEVQMDNHSGNNAQKEVNVDDTAKPETRRRMTTRSSTVSKSHSDNAQKEVQMEDHSGKNTQNEVQMEENSGNNALKEVKIDDTVKIETRKRMTTRSSTVTKSHSDNAQKEVQMEDHSGNNTQNEVQMEDHIGNNTQNEVQMEENSGNNAQKEVKTGAKTETRKRMTTRSSTVTKSHSDNAQKEVQMEDHSGNNTQNEVQMEDHIGNNTQNEVQMEENSGNNAQKEVKTGAKTETRKRMTTRSSTVTKTHSDNAQKEVQMKDHSGNNTQNEVKMEENSGNNTQNEVKMEENSGNNTQNEVKMEENSGNNTQNEVKMEENSGNNAQKVFTAMTPDENQDSINFIAAKKFIQVVKVKLKNTAKADENIKKETLKLQNQIVKLGIQRNNMDNLDNYVDQNALNIDIDNHITKRIETLDGLARDIEKETESYKELAEKIRQSTRNIQNYCSTNNTITTEENTGTVKTEKKEYTIDDTVNKENLGRNNNYMENVKTQSILITNSAQTESTSNNENNKSTSTPNQTDEKSASKAQDTDKDFDTNLAKRKKKKKCDNVDDMLNVPCANSILYLDMDTLAERYLETYNFEFNKYAETEDMIVFRSCQEGTCFLIVGYKMEGKPLHVYQAGIMKMNGTECTEFFVIDDNVYFQDEYEILSKVSPIMNVYGEKMPQTTQIKRFSVSHDESLNDTHNGRINIIAMVKFDSNTVNILTNDKNIKKEPELSVYNRYRSNAGRIYTLNTVTEEFTMMEVFSGYNGTEDRRAIHHRLSMLGFDFSDDNIFAWLSTFVPLTKLKKTVVHRHDNVVIIGNSLKTLYIHCNPFKCSGKKLYLFSARPSMKIDMKKLENVKFSKDITPALNKISQIDAVPTRNGVKIVVLVAEMLVAIDLVHAKEPEYYMKAKPKVYRRGRYVVGRNPWFRRRFMDDDEFDGDYSDDYHDYDNYYESDSSDDDERNRIGDCSIM